MRGAEEDANDFAGPLGGETRRWGCGSRGNSAADGEGDFRAPLADLTVADSIDGLVGPFHGGGRRWHGRSGGKARGGQMAF